MTSFDAITGTIFLLVGLVALGFYDLEILFYILLIILGMFLINKVNYGDKKSK